MDEAIDALLQFDKPSEVRQVPDTPPVLRTHGILLLNLLPGVRCELFQPQGNPLSFRVHV